MKGLEQQLEHLHEKHQDLLHTYTRQRDEVSRLNARISELNTELNALRSCQDQSFSEMLLPNKFDKFDAFSAHDMLYTGSGSSSSNLNSDFGLQSFEESL